MREIDSQRMIIRQPILRDFEALFQIHADPATNRYNPANR